MIDLELNMFKNFAYKKFSKYLLVGFSALVLLYISKAPGVLSLQVAQALSCTPEQSVNTCHTLTGAGHTYCVWNANGNTESDCKVESCFGGGTPPNCGSGADQSITNQTLPCMTNPGLCGANETYCENTGTNQSTIFLKHEGACHPENGGHDGNGCIFIFTPLSLQNFACGGSSPAAPANPAPAAPQQPAAICQVNYSLNNSNPTPNSDVVVTISTVQNTNPACVTLSMDGNYIGTQNCGISGGNVICHVNSGNAGTHTLQFKTGQSSQYPGINCGNQAIDCNSTSFTTQAAAANPVCVVNYSLDNSNPAPNSSVAVTISNIQTTNPSCVVLTQDGQVQNCHLSGNNVVCNVNSGNAGAHNLQFLTGQSQAYPTGTNCGSGPITCNATSYTTTAAVVPPACVADTCSASAPACGQTTTGVDNCGKACTKQGSTCPTTACVSDKSCSAPVPACGTSTTGVDNCGNVCTKQGISCPATMTQGCPTGTQMEMRTVNGSNVQVCVQTVITNTVVNNNTSSSTSNAQGGSSTVTITNPAPVILASAGNLGIGPSYVAGVQYTTLPKTGLPALAWSALAFIPAGFKMRRFSKTRKDLEDHPSFISEDRQFRAGA